MWVTFNKHTQMYVWESNVSFKEFAKILWAQAAK